MGHLSFLGQFFSLGRWSRKGSVRRLSIEGGKFHYSGLVIKKVPSTVWYESFSLKTPLVVLAKEPFTKGQATQPSHSPCTRLDESKLYMSLILV